jgi:hypothetical protein
MYEDSVRVDKRKESVTGCLQLVNEQVERDVLSVSCIPAPTFFPFFRGHSDFIISLIFKASASMRASLSGLRTLHECGAFVFVCVRLLLWDCKTAD